MLQDIVNLAIESFGILSDFILKPCRKPFSHNRPNPTHMKLTAWNLVLSSVLSVVFSLRFYESRVSFCECR